MGSLQKTLGSRLRDPVTMSLSNELSSEIALAILAEKRTPQELLALRDLLFQVHDELQRMAHKTSDQPERARNQTHPTRSARHT